VFDEAESASTALTFNQLVESGIFELGNKTENENYNERVPTNTSFDKFNFLSKLSESGTVTRRKRKRNERNEDKKKNQIKKILLNDV